MPLPDDITLTLHEARQGMARLAATYGIPFDRLLVERSTDILEDIILEACLGPARAGPYDEPAWGQGPGAPKGAWGNAGDTAGPARACPKKS